MPRSNYLFIVFRAKHVYFAVVVKLLQSTENGSDLPCLLPIQLGFHWHDKTHTAQRQTVGSIFLLANSRSEKKKKNDLFKQRVTCQPVIHMLREHWCGRRSKASGTGDKNCLLENMMICLYPY